MAFKIAGREYDDRTQVRARIAEIHDENDGALPDAARAEWNELNELEARYERVAQLARNADAHDGDGTTFRRVPSADLPRGNVGETRDAALRVLERCARDGDLSAAAADRVDGVLRGPDAGLGVDAAYVRAVGDPDYERAFAKMIAYGANAILRMSPAEQAAVQAVTGAEEQRAMVEGTGSAGGFGIPIAIDPTITLSSSGVLNPVRDMATVRTMSTRELRLTTSDGVTAQYTPEATEAVDNSPTLVQPTLIASKATSFVPFSFELGDDWPSLRGELAKLISDAKDVLEATKFLTGSGTNEPQGILTGLSTTQRVQTATVATYAVGDAWLLKAAVPARFVSSSEFLANPATFDLTYRFVGGNSTEPLQFDTGRGGTFLGRPKGELSTMATGSTTGTKLIVGGDLATGYVIGDRLGMSLEIIPHLFGAANRYPTGQRGAYAYWRNDGRVAVPNALRYLEVK
jgi:HK97 family phage major capsid protein